MRAVLLTLVACSHPQPVAPHAMFEIHPVADKPYCYFDEHPKPPELPNVDSDNSDVIDRVSIHRRTYAEAIQYMHDLALWDEQVLVCLRRLTE